MTGVVFSITFDDAVIRAGLDRVGASLAAPEGLLAQIGVYGRDSTKRGMMAQTSPDGTAYKELSPAYAQIKPAGFGILFGGVNTLFESMTFRVGADEVRWGSTVVYAAVHQFGATIRPKNAKALSFVLGDTFGVGTGKLYGKTQGVLVQVQSVTIPARPYLGLSAEDREEITALAEDYLRGQLYA